MDLITIIMGLRNRTINKIDDLATFFKTKSRTDALVRAIRLSYMIVIELYHGGRIESHRRNGEVKQLIVIDPNTGRRINV